jgi:eukaryotic-like serine/threonine-protein kinase
VGNYEPSNSRRHGGRDASVDLVDPPVIASGRRLAERYRLERPLGHGGMASVWLATDERLDRPVAIKVLSDSMAADDEYLVRFRREARVAARLQHPNLVGVYDFDAGARPYLVMEYVPGGDLGSRAAAGDVPEPKRLARELLLALRHIHAAGVLHRDIKPQNVLIDADGRARLTDFGIAQPHDATSLTRAGHVIGTERYIAPEVRSGEPASERSDLFALGVVLADMAQEHGSGGLGSLTARLRDPDPDRRPRSASAALAALEREPAAGVTTQPYAVGDAPTTEPLRERTPPRGHDEPAPPRRPFEPTPTRRSRRVRAWAIAGLAAVALAGGVAIAIGLGAGDDSGSPSPQVAKQDGRQGSRGGGDREASAAPAAPSDGAASGGDSASAPTEASGVPAASEPSSSGGTATDGTSLNDQGFQLVQDGSYDEAIPVLERAVDELRGSGDELTYNYALYNLGTAYVGAGRPDEAIPVLEERMQYDDGQLDTVQATLDDAYAAAGQAPPEDEAAGEEPSGSEKPGNGPKPGKGPAG